METQPPIVIKRNVMSKTSWLDETVLTDNLIANEEDFQKLWDLHPPEPHKVVIYGKLTPTPRYQQAYLRSYKFSGTESQSLPLPELLKPYLEWANNLGYGDFNAVLINWYKNGENYIGSHSDDERQLVANSPVVTITLCQPSEAEKKGFIAKPTLRKFRIRDKETNEIVKDVQTANGSVLIMGGRFQKKFRHEIVKITGAIATKVGPRISITLRQFENEVLKTDVCASCAGEAFFREEAVVGTDMMGTLYFCGAECQREFHTNNV